MKTEITFSVTFLSFLAVSSVGTNVSEIKSFVCLKGTITPTDSLKVEKLIFYDVTHLQSHPNINILSTGERVKYNTDCQN